MKKTIYSILAVAAGVILASGCSKELNPVENNTTGEITLSASLPGELTKAAVDGTDNTKVNWSADDAISVWGGENNQFTISNGEGIASASFSGTVTSGTAQYAMSPYSATATIDAGVITTNVPNTQTAPAGSFDPVASIIVGTISGSAITFHHALAYLKITAPSDVTNLIEITIESNGGVQLTGDAKFSTADGAFTATGTPCKYVTIKPSTGTFTSNGIYYAAVIPGTYTGGLTVKYLYKEETNHRLIEKSKSNTTKLEIEAGHTKLLGAAVEPITESIKAVQLWSGGPYWSTTNIGATTSTDYGQYFAWGDVTGQTWSGSAWSGDGFSSAPTVELDGNKLKPVYDAASQNWGTSWSMPTDEDLSNLISETYTTIEYVKSGSANWEIYNVRGLLITGKTSGYTSNSIFLPVAGRGENNSCYDPGEIGHYWSSVQGTNGAYYLYILVPTPEDEEDGYESESSVCDDVDTPKYTGMSVRPVRSSL